MINLFSINKSSNSFNKGIKNQFEVSEKTYFNVFAAFGFFSKNC